MDILVLANLVVTVAYYLIVAFFLLAIVRTLIKSEDAENVIVYCLMLVPFLLRLIRIK